MARPRKPAAEAAKEESKQLVLKLVPPGTLKSWLSAKAKAKEAVKDITHGIGEHTREAQKKGLDKNVGNLIAKLCEYTPEKLAIWKAHFDDCWEKAGLEKKAASADHSETGEGEHEEEEETTVTPFRQAAE